MKKRFIPVLLLPLMMGACNKINLPETPNIKTAITNASSSNVFAYQAATSIGMLSQLGESTSGVRALMNETPDEDLINLIKEYLPSIEAAISGDSLLSNVVESESDLEEYTYKVVVSYKDMAMVENSFTLYYNETEIVREDDEFNGDKDFDGDHHHHIDHHHHGDEKDHDNDWSNDHEDELPPDLSEDQQDWSNEDQEEEWANKDDYSYHNGGTHRSLNLDGEEDEEEVVTDEEDTEEETVDEDVDTEDEEEMVEPPVHTHEDKEFRIDGIIIIGEETFEIEGRKELDENNEYEFKFRYIIDEESYVSISQEVEEDEVEFSYEIVSRGRTIYSYSIEFDNDEVELSLKDSSTYSNYKMSFKFIDWDGKTLIKATIKDGKQKTFVLFEKVVDTETGEVSYIVID